MPAYTNAKQTIPFVFQEIIKLDNRRRYLQDKTRTENGCTQEEWVELKGLWDRLYGLKQDAEKILHWNTDKGAS